MTAGKGSFSQSGAHLSARLVLLLVGLSLACPGCATTQPRRAPRVELGMTVEPLDELADGLAIIDQLLYWNEQLENHNVSQETVEAMRRYLEAHAEELTGLVVRVNQWKPQDDLLRLITNHHVAWPYRLLAGVPATLGEALFP